MIPRHRFQDQSETKTLKFESSDRFNMRHGKLNGGTSEEKLRITKSRHNYAYKAMMRP